MIKSVIVYTPLYEDIYEVRKVITVDRRLLILTALAKYEGNNAADNGNLSNRTKT